jgi:4-hydroxy-tetrahydrodipicolinate reductase
MVKAVVTGAGGRMGGRIIHTIQAAEGIELAGAVDLQDHPWQGRDIGECLGLSLRGVRMGDDLAAALKGADVVIDFTHHEASVRHAEIARDLGKAIVIGTTGLTAAETDRVREIAKDGRCVLAPNMSVGVNVLFKVLDLVAGILGDDYDVEIVESHHNLKKDAPSGTAMKMAQVIAARLDRDLDQVGIYERKGMIGERTKKEIGIQTLRGGDIVGEHTVMFVTGGERLEFIHRAHSRDNFARGAVRAAKWIVGQPKGFYDMQDVLGLRS